MDAVGGASVDYTARVTESVLARLHIVVRVARGQSVPEVDAEALEARIAEVVLSWDDELSIALVAASSEAEAHALLAGYPEGFPRRTARSPPPRRRWPTFRDRAADPRSPLRVSLQPAAEASGEQANARLKLYSLMDISLAEVLPVLSSLGVQVVTEQPFRLVRSDADGRPGRCLHLRLRPARARVRAPRWRRRMWE